jgi:sulfatase maturation enzyme AslB (radical SAM superfamily)
MIEVAKSAVSNGISLDIGVSLDGIGDDHDKIRGVKGNFQKVDWLFNQLVKLREGYKDRLRVDAGIVISDLTLYSLEQVREYTGRLGIGLTEAWYNETTFYSNVGKKKFGKELISAVKTQPDSLLKELWLRYLDGKSIKFLCFAMHTFCVLKCNGDIVPCLNMFDKSGGNVRNKKPIEIWHSREMQKIRKEIDNCQGCLNSWGAPWSFSASFYPLLFFYLKKSFIAVFGKLVKK